MFCTVQAWGLLQMLLGSNMLSNMTLGTFQKICVANRALKNLTATLVWRLWDFLCLYMLKRRYFGFKARKFEGLDFKVDFLAFWLIKSIKEGSELWKHFLMRLRFNFYVHNGKIDIPEAQNVKTWKFEKSIFGGSKGCIFLKDFVRRFCEHFTSKCRFGEIKFPKTSGKCLRSST